MKHELIGKGEIIPLGLFGVVKAKHQSVLFSQIQLCFNRDIWNEAIKQQTGP